MLWQLLLLFCMLVHIFIHSSFEHVDRISFDDLLEVQVPIFHNSLTEEVFAAQLR